MSTLSALFLLGAAPAYAASSLGLLDAKTSTNAQSGTDASLFQGSVTASCPAGTGDSYFSIDGPDLPADQAILGQGNATGTGAQSFSGASIANLKSANAGAFASSGLYTIRFNCIAASNGASTDEYTRGLQYTGGGGGAFTFLASPPSAPTGVTATAGDTTAAVSWTAAATAANKPVTGYTVTATPTSGAPVVVSGLTGTSTTLTGLTNGTDYVVTVTATSTEGTSAASAGAPVTPRGVPAAPAAPTATAGDGQATVTVAAPAANGSPVLDYTVTASPGGATATGTSPLTVAGLTNGVAYTFTATARNAVGSSPASAASNAVTPAAPTAPSAVTGVSAVAGNASAAVSWTAPTSDGGAPISSYTVTATPSSGSPVVVSGVTGTSRTVTGLTNGTTYSVTVTATNSAGTSAPSAAATVTPVTVPGAPTGVSATKGDTTTAVRWTAAPSGGSAVLDYTVTATPTSGTARSVVVSGTTATLTGLVNGTAYAVTVAARNAQGSGPASTATSVTPSGLPGVPAAPTATAGNSSAAVAFAAPSANGAAITGYTVTASPGGATATGTGSPITVSGLANGTSYTFTVTAQNGNGAGSASPASNAVTPTDTVATSTTLAVSDDAVVIGAPVTLTGTVSGASTGSVTLRSYPARGAAVDSVYPLATGGTYSITVTPYRTTSFRVLFLGDSSHLPSTSPSVRTTVAGKTAFGTLTRTRTGVLATGRVLPGVAGQSVTLVELRGTRVIGLARVTTDSAGRFRLPASVGRGVHVLQLRAANSTISLGAVSTSRRITV